MLIMIMMLQHLYAGNADDDLALQMIWFLDDLVFSTNMLMKLLIVSLFIYC